MFADITSDPDTSWGRPAKPYPTCFRTTVMVAKSQSSVKKGGKHPMIYRRSTIPGGAGFRNPQ